MSLRHDTHTYHRQHISIKIVVRGRGVIAPRNINVQKSVGDLKSVSQTESNKKTNFWITSKHKFMWYWIQAGLINFMLFTGFEIHGLTSFFGFESAVHIHKVGIYLIPFTFTVPIAASLLSKKSPINTRGVLIGSMVLFFQFITGIIYMSHNYWESSILILSLKTIAYLHTIGAFIIIVYGIINIYTSIVLPKINRKSNRRIIYYPINN